VLIAAVFEASAGGPRDIAGTVFFEPAAKGTPLTWADGTVTYYTDRGALSPILSEAAADALVANAFSRWTSISTAAIVARRGGQLGCDRPCNRRSSKSPPARPWRVARDVSRPASWNWDCWKLFDES
jgi:hypothetical protein